MTIEQLTASLLVVGDGTSSSWDEPWRRQLVGNLRQLFAHLQQVGITDLYLDGSFCSDKDHPGDIDGYFVTGLPAWAQAEAQLMAMDPAWDLGAAMPDAQGKPKPLMWHRYRVELFPVFHPPFEQFSSTGGSPPVTIDRFFHQSRSGEQRGVVRLLPDGGAP